MLEVVYGSRDIRSESLNYKRKLIIAVMCSLFSDRLYYYSLRSRQLHAPANPYALQIHANTKLRICSVRSTTQSEYVTIFFSSRAADMSQKFRITKRRSTSWVWFRTRCKKGSMKLWARTSVQAKLNPLRKSKHFIKTVWTKVREART